LTSLPFLRAWRDLRPVVPGNGDKSPFFAPAPAPSAPGAPVKAALVLHGFSGTPFEVRPIAEGLAARGYAVLAPLLEGHGGTVEDLGRTRWPDWFASAERALERLKAEAGGGPVAVAGFSLGGLLGLRLARLHPEDVAVLAVMSAPLRLQGPEVLAVRLLAALPRWLRRGWLGAWPKLRGYDVTDERMQRENPGLEALPIPGVASMLALAELVRRDLPAIRTPALVAHGDRDRTVPFVDALEVLGCLGSTEIERCWLPGSGHLVAIDVDRTVLVEAVARFFDRHLGPRPARAAPDTSRPPNLEASS
jgi:carboxylesterase